MLGEQTGLTARSSLTELHMNGRRSIRVDYSGDDIRAAVVVTQLAPGHMLMLSLATKQVSFISHRPLLDVVGFSVTGPGGGEIPIKEKKKQSSSKPADKIDSENPFSSLKKTIRNFFKKLESND